MARHFFTADDIYHLYRQQKSVVLLLGSDDIITAEAEDLASKLGLAVVRETGIKQAAVEQPLAEALAVKTSSLPPLRIISGSRVILEKFGSDSPGQVNAAWLKDVITSADHSPMSAGYMALDGGSFAWSLTYDEIDIVLEGKLEIKRGEETVCGEAGDVIFIPKGSSVVFSSPGKVRFVYVTFPADWQTN